MTTPSEDEILALAKKATPGPWDCRIAYESDGGVVDPHTYKAPGYYNNGGVYSPTADQWPVACDEYNIFEKPDDWAYIAAANPAAIIALIERHSAEVERLTRELRESHLQEISTTGQLQSAQAEIGRLLKDLNAAESALATAREEALRRAEEIARDYNKPNAERLCCAGRNYQIASAIAAERGGKG